MNQEIPIRNYKGELPLGMWYCEESNFSTTNIKEAAEHSWYNNCWVWLIPDNSNEQTFEIHPSDIDGVYLSSYYKKKTYNDISHNRQNCINKH